MELFEFLVIMTGAAFLMFGLMISIEKIFLKLAGQKGPPIVRIAIGFVVVTLLLSTVMLYLGSTFGIYVILLSGFIVIINRYWLGHFSVKQRK